MVMANSISFRCPKCEGEGSYETCHPMWGSPSCPEAYVQTKCSECDGEGQQSIRAENAGEYIDDLRDELDNVEHKARKTERELKSKIYWLESQLRNLNAGAA